MATPPWERDWSAIAEANSDLPPWERDWSGANLSNEEEEEKDFRFFEATPEPTPQDDLEERFKLDQNAPASVPEEAPQPELTPDDGPAYWMSLIGTPSDRPLPAPNQDMYRGLNMEEARALFETYTSNEGVRPSNGALRVLPGSQDAWVDPETGTIRGVPEPQTIGPASEIPVLGRASNAIYRAVAPDSYNAQPAKTPAVDQFFDGGGEVVSNTAEAGAALLDEAPLPGGALPGVDVGDVLRGATGRGLTERVQDEGLVRSTGDSFTHAIVGEALPVISTLFIGGGTGALTKLPANLTRGQTILKNIFTRATGGTVAARSSSEALQAASATFADNAAAVAQTLGDGAFSALRTEGLLSAAVGSDTGTLLVGENAMLPVIEGFAEGDEASEAVLAARGNVLMDALIGSGVMEAGMIGVRGAVSVANNMIFQPLISLAGLKSIPAREREVVDQILNDLSIIEAESTGEAVEEVRERLINTIAQNRNVVVQIGERGDEDLIVALDTITALTRSGELSPAAIAQATGTRTGVLNSGNGSRTLQAMADAPSKLEDTVSALEDARGGTAGINQAGEELVATGQSTIDEALGEVRLAEADLQAAQARIDQVLQGDSPLARELQRLEIATPTGSGAALENIRGTMQEELIRIYRQLTNEKNARFEAIQGGAVDWDGLYNAIQGAGPRDMLEALQGDARANAPMRSFLQALSPQQVEDVRPRYDADGNVLRDESTNEPLMETIMRPETDEERAFRINNWAEEENIDFGRLYRDFRPMLRDLANDAAQNGNNIKARNIQSVIRHIDEDQANFVVSQGDEEAAAAAREALDYYRDVYSVYNDGILGDAREVFQRNNLRLDPDSPAPTQTINLSTQTQNLLQETLEGQNTTARITQLADQLEQYGSTPDNQNLVGQYLMARIVSDAYAQIQDNGLQNVDVGQIREGIRSIGAVLEQRYPGSAEEVNRFIDTIGSARDVAGVRAEALETAQKRADETIDSVHRGILQNLISRHSGRESLETTSDVYSNLQRLLFGGANAVDNAEELLALAGDNPLAVEGLQAAYLRGFRNQVFSKGRDAAGSRTPTPSRFNDISVDEVRPTLEVGRRLFADTPEIMAAIETLYDVAGNTEIRKRASAIGGQSATAYNQNIQRSVQRMVFMTVGPLTRIGARATALTGTLIDRIDPANIQANVLDSLLADPERFVEVARNMQRGPLDAQDIRYLTRVAVQSGLYGQDADEDTIYQEISARQQDLQNGSGQSLQDLGYTPYSAPTEAPEAVPGPDSIPYFLRAPEDQKGPAPDTMPRLLDGDDRFKRIADHLKEKEGGSQLTGYIPTDGSGVTIAAGLDLGQHDVAGLMDLGIPQGIIDKVEPYLGLSTRAEVDAAGLNPADMVLTEEEAAAVDRALMEDHMEALEQVDTSNLSEQGVATLVSLRHWAGQLGRDSTKLAPNGSNPLWPVLEAGGATDEDVLAALQEILPGHRPGTAAYNRIRAEIQSLSQ